MSALFLIDNQHYIIPILKLITLLSDSGLSEGKSEEKGESFFSALPSESFYAVNPRSFLYDFWGSRQNRDILIRFVVAMFLSCSPDVPIT